MSLKNKSCALNPLTPLSGGIFRKIFIGIFAGFLFLNVSVVTAQGNVGQGNVFRPQGGWENGVPTLINTPYFQGLGVDNTDASPIYGMSQGYYNYTKNWHNYKNVTPVALERKFEGDDATATSPYVFADEFNTIVGALRGIWNAVSGGEHFFGINGEPTNGVRLTVHGEVQLGNGACPDNCLGTGFPTSPQAGEILFNTADTHFWYYNGTSWRQLDTPDCDSCTAYEYTCEDDNDNDETGVWNGGTVECSPANFDASGGTDYIANTASDTVCSAEDMSTPEAEALCSVGGAGIDEVCEPVVDHYETRCDPATNTIFWYDDCGEKASGGGSPFVEACANGCHDVVDYSACFVAGTQITMADGSKKNIEEVRIGEKIRGISGINTVVGFHRPLLGKKALYAFNDGEAFVTAEHPFLTTDGWKALDPKLAKSVHLDIEIGQLAVGDTLITETGEVKLEKISRKDSILSAPAGLIPSTARFSREVIESRDFAPAKTQLYNFKLDGDHTYIADGFVVHNKQDCGSGGCICEDIDQDGECDYYSYPLAGRTGHCADANSTPCAFDSECQDLLSDPNATCDGMIHPMHPQYSTGVGFCCDSQRCYNTTCTKDADCSVMVGQGSWCDMSNPQYTGDYTCADGEKGCGTGSGWTDPYDTDNYEYNATDLFYDSPRSPNVKFAGICNDQGCGGAENEINVF